MRNWREIEQKTNRKGGRISKASPNSVRITCIKDKKKSADGCDYVSFTIGVDVCKKLRWLIGDKLEVRVSDDGLIGLMRTPHGNTLSMCGEGSEKHIGKCCKGIMRVCLSKEIVGMLFKPDDAKTILLDAPLIDEAGVLVLG